MRTSTIAGLLSAAALVAASPLTERNNDGKSSRNQAGYKPRVGPSNANCRRETYEITVTSENTVFQNVNPDANQTVQTLQLSEFVAGLTSMTSNFTDTYTEPQKRNVTGTYSISGTLCTPKSGDPGNGKIQLLVHGIGFDSSYWDFASSEKGEDYYSYVAAAADAGHSTFRYDRLGTGLSEHPADTFNVVQASTDVAILTEIVKMLKAGKVGGKAYNSIAAIGHSYGSVQTQTITQRVPDAFDTVILTGFSTYTDYVPLYLTSTAYSPATSVAPERFPEGTFPYDNSYLITATPYTNQLNFAYFPYFTNAAVSAARASEQPVTRGVLYTFGSFPGPAPAYTGNVHVVTGDRDWIFCGLQCFANAPTGQSSIPAGVTALYPAAASFSAYVPLDVGHGINFHVQAPQVYAETLAYLDRVFYN